MGKIGLPCTPPPPQDSLRPSFFAPWTSPDIKSRCHQKRVGIDYLFFAIFLCHNLSSKAVRVTKLVSIHMFLGARNLSMPIKNVSVLWKIYKQLFKPIFRAFSVIFCANPWVREGYCVPSNHENLRPSFFLLIRPPPISLSNVSS